MPAIEKRGVSTTKRLHHASERLVFRGGREPSDIRLGDDVGVDRNALLADGLNRHVVKRGAIDIVGGDRIAVVPPYRHEVKFAGHRQPRLTRHAQSPSKATAPVRR